MHCDCTDQLSTSQLTYLWDQHSTLKEAFSQPTMEYQTHEKDEILNDTTTVVPVFSLYTFLIYCTPYTYKLSTDHAFETLFGLCSINYVNYLFQPQWV